MALQAYLTLKGQKQGAIKGSVTQKGREDSIAVIAADHLIQTSIDPQSGLPTGKRMHKPIVITKELDQSTPLLYNALVNNETLTEFTLRFWAPQVKATGTTPAEEQNFTITLTNARITSIEFKMPDVKDPSMASFNESEEISFTYQKITWTWTKGGITAADDWETRV